MHERPYVGAAHLAARRRADEHGDLVVAVRAVRRLGHAVQQLAHLEIAVTALDEPLRRGERRVLHLAGELDVRRALRPFDFLVESGLSTDATPSETDIDGAGAEAGA